MPNDVDKYSKILQDEVNLNIKVGLAITQRTSFGLTHLTTSSHLVRKAIAVEQEKSTSACPSPVAEEHKAYVTSAIVMSVAFLEATINEFFEDCSDDQYKILKDISKALNEDRINLVKEIWGKLELPKKASLGILDKYDLALMLFDNCSCDKGVEPFQSAALVVKLRNALVHAGHATATTYSTIENMPVTPQEWEKRLRGKFIENPLTGPGNAFYPDKMLSAGCAKWALSSAINFTDEFFKQIGIVPPYDHVKNKILIT
jgi:hypothetical protein